MHHHTHRRMHQHTQLRVSCTSTSRLLNFTDVSTWFQLPPDSISEHANLKFFLGSMPPDPSSGACLHVRFTPPNCSLALPPLVCSPSIVIEKVGSTGWSESACCTRNAGTFPISFWIPFWCVYIEMANSTRALSCHVWFENKLHSWIAHRGDWGDSCSLSTPILHTCIKY